MVFSRAALLALALSISGCSEVPSNHTFLMPDGRKGAIVSVSGNGVTPPIVAVITPKKSAYNVRVVSAEPPVQALMQGALSGIAIGAGLAAQGAYIRPSRVSASANNIGGNATGGNATGGTASGGAILNCVTGSC